RDLDVVSGLETLLSERLDHADSAKPTLEVGERVLVGQVVARDQPLYPAARDPEAALARSLNRPCPLGARPVHTVLGQLAGETFSRRLGGLDLLRRHAGEQLAAELVQPEARRRGCDDHGRLGPQALTPSVGCLHLSPRIDEVSL